MFLFQLTACDGGEITNNHFQLKRVTLPWAQIGLHSLKKLKYKLWEKWKSLLPQISNFFLKETAAGHYVYICTFPCIPPAHTCICAVVWWECMLTCYIVVPHALVASFDWALWGQRTWRMPEQIPPASVDQWLLSLSLVVRINSW